MRGTLNTKASGTMQRAGEGDKQRSKTEHEVNITNDAWCM